MNFEFADKVAKTVLYEGYLLYPYRPSALKNSQRWMFGTLFPQRQAARDLPENPFSLQAECIALVSAAPVLHAKFRFLQFADRDRQCSRDQSRGQVRDAEEREVMCGPVLFSDLLATTLCIPFSFDAENSIDEPVQTLRGRIYIEASALQGDLWKITARAENCTPIPESELVSRTSRLSRCLASAQLILGIENGEFLSLLDPPEQFREAVANCRNLGVFPVLVGESSARNMMLAAPIILYDYPQIAPESSGDFFDATEIDELLALRVKTLTDDEKAQMRKAEIRSRQILDRTEALSIGALANLHGRLRMLDPSGDRPEEQKGTSRDPIQGPAATCQVGDRVRLWPQKSADIMDIVLKGQVAIVESTETDYDGKLHVAVVLEEDPGAEFGYQRQIAHRFFFSPEELERLTPRIQDGPSH
jgi:hypothetical protein